MSLNTNSLFLVFLLILFGCNGDGTILITKGYYFIIMDRELKSIVYRDQNMEIGKIILGTKVEGYYLRNNYIFASRREQIFKQGKIISIKQCEYWMINTKNHSVEGPFNFEEIHKIDEWIALNNTLQFSNNLSCPLLWEE